MGTRGLAGASALRFGHIAARRNNGGSIKARRAGGRFTNAAPDGCRQRAATHRTLPCLLPRRAQRPLPLLRRTWFTATACPCTRGRGHAGLLSGAKRIALGELGRRRLGATSRRRILHFLVQRTTPANGTQEDRCHTSEAPRFAARWPCGMRLGTAADSATLRRRNLSSLHLCRRCPLPNDGAAAQDVGFGAKLAAEPITLRPQHIHALAFFYVSRCCNRTHLPQHPRLHDGEVLLESVRRHCTTERVIVSRVVSP